MASTDIRATIQRLENIEDQSNDTYNQVQAQGVTITSTVAEMVIERVITVQKAAFTLLNGFWIATIDHLLNNSAPGIAVYDNDGDLQLVQYIASNPNSGRLEMSQSQYDDSNFPFKVSVQGKSTASVPAVGMSGYAVPAVGRKYRLLALEDGGKIQSAVIGTEVWEDMAGANGFSAGHIVGEMLYILFNNTPNVTTLPSSQFGGVSRESYDSSRLVATIL